LRESSTRNQTADEAMTASDSRPLISLIVACYKHEKFIAKAIDGVLS